MTSALFIKSKTENVLREFTNNIGRILNLPPLQMRQSDNYFGGEYFQCEVLGLVLKAVLCDRDDFPDHRFELLFALRGDLVNDGFPIDGIADLVAKRLALFGYEVIREEKLGCFNSPYTSYRQNENPNAADSEKIITESFIP